MVWIRTQDQRNLLHVDQIVLRGKKIQGVIQRHPMKEWSETVGKYDSNERAEEVLDKIYRKIEASTRPVVSFSMPEK